MDSMPMSSPTVGWVVDVLGEKIELKRFGVHFATDLFDRFILLIASVLDFSFLLSQTNIGNYMERLLGAKLAALHTFWNITRL